MRRYGPESIVLLTAVSKAMVNRSSMLDYEGTIGTADVLRNELMEHRNWKFNGDFEAATSFFLTHLLFGRHVHKVSEMRIDEILFV